MKEAHSDLMSSPHMWLERRLKAIFRVFMVQLMLLTVRLLRLSLHKTIQDMFQDIKALINLSDYLVSFLYSFIVILFVQSK